MKNPLKMFCENPQIFWQSTVPYISFLIATIWIKPTLLRKNEKKNYIDIFIWCGEIHLYAFFCIFFQKKTFWYQILARETDYRVLHYSHGQKTHMPCIKVDKTYMSRFIITGLVPLYAYFYILPNYSAFSLKIPTRDLW